jgi:HEAT repeat protein
MRLLVRGLAVLTLGLTSCTGSRDKLLADLQSPQPEVRAQAVRHLADDEREEDLVLFTRAAKDPAAMVRNEAVTALEKSPDPRVVDLLGELLEDPSVEVQAQAALALAHFKSDKAKAYLTLQYGRRGRSTRIAIVKALKETQASDAMKAVVTTEALSLLETNSKAFAEGALPEKVAATEELGKSGRPDAVIRLLPFLKDNHVVLAAAAVRGLGYAGDRSAAEPIAALLKENFPELREAALEALARLQAPETLPKLKEVALEESNASRLAMRAILALPDTAETREALCSVVLRAGESVALMAGLEMRHRGGCPVEPILEQLAKNKEPVVALHALQGLGPLAKPLVGKVIPFLASTDNETITAAANALAEMGNPSASKEVLAAYDKELRRIQALGADWIPKGKEVGAPSSPKVIQGSDSDEKSIAGKVADLFNRGDSQDDPRRSRARIASVPDVPEELVDDLEPATLRTLSSLIRSLGVLKAPGAFDLLKKHAGEGNTTLRAAALTGLSFLGPEGIAIARDGLYASNLEIQRAASTALMAQGDAGQSLVVEAAMGLAGDRTPLMEALEGARLTPATAFKLAPWLSEGGAESVLAARALGRAVATDAIPLLTRGLEDPSSIARKDMLLALGKLGDPKSAQVIGLDLFHDNPDVRAAAAEALSQLGGPEQLEALTALKADYYRRVRDAASATVTAITARNPPQAKN